ncbi:glycosyltransferase family 90 protein [Xylariaceae sp. FL1651]|nr:glycosyltransferase family 90 protein [Xylariaceae sp. FL1651]
MMAPSQRSMNIAALCLFGLSNLYLQSRYYTSAAFERPIHFSVATLTLAGFALWCLAGFLGFESRHREYPWTKILLASPTLLPTSFHGLRNWAHSRAPSVTWAYLVFCVILRTVLNWRIVRTIHCSRDGLHLFLPFFLALCDHPYLRAIRHPKCADDETFARTPVVRFASIALLWGFAASDLFLLREDKTNVICPAGWYIERFIPVAQLLALSLDAIIIAQVGRLRQNSQDQPTLWHFLGTLFLASASILAFLAAWSCLDRVNLRWNIFLTQLELRDLFVDSTIAGVALVSGIYLLGNFHSNLIALLAAATSASVLILAKCYDGTLAVIWSGFWGLATGLVAFLGMGALLHLCKVNLTSTAPPHREGSFATSRYIIGALVSFLVVFFHAFFISARVVYEPSPRQPMANARKESDSWLATATKSTTLESAVGEYRQRYGLPPPPNFDKWYAFTTSVKSPVIDIYDQINSDLLPFWAIPPAVLRERTTHLLEHPKLSIGGLLVEGGKISVSPHIHGTHRWMMSVIEDMVRPFAQWLPDMHLAFNLDDECRVSVPATDMGQFIDEALATRSRLDSKHNLASFSPSQSPPWATEFLVADQSIWEERSNWFLDRSKGPIFYEWISPTCPANALANKAHWWNRKTRCSDCSSPHTQSGFVCNWTMAGDLCHQPDLAYLHGFLTSPAAMAATHTLFPVFSQSRVHNFADILYPSPWNFGDKVTYEEARDIPWEQKLNSVYWRGASSDGFATHGSWQMFLRARFVHLVSSARAAVDSYNVFRFLTRRHQNPSVDSGILRTSDSFSERDFRSKEQIAVNVSFVGNFSRCDERDCLAERVTFYGTSSSTSPVAIDFQESWQHRYLVDLDGAAFSGRFLPFLQSASLPYRASIFRTWWEERVHAWKHFIPIDIRLGDFWAALDYFGGVGVGEAEEIAQAGQQWAQKALRKEDMQVYMFRLLLEWGRIIDDQREDIGFSP